MKDSKINQVYPIFRRISQENVSDDFLVCLFLDACKSSATFNLLKMWDEENSQVEKLEILEELKKLMKDIERFEQKKM